MRREHLKHLLFAAMAVFADPHSQAQSMGNAARGELLYTTHCIECHTTQVHWREKRLATNWATLQAQITRWQANAGLNWNRSEIEDVSRFLNQRYYQFSIPVKAMPEGAAKPRPT